QLVNHPHFPYPTLFRSIIATAKQLVGPQVDIFLEEVHRAVGEHKVRAAGMTGLEAEDDGPVITGPGGIVLGGHGLPVLIQMAIRDRKSTRLNSSHQIIS